MDLLSAFEEIARQQGFDDPRNEAKAVFDSLPVEMHDIEAIDDGSTYQYGTLNTTESGRPFAGTNTQHSTSFLFNGLRKFFAKCDSADIEHFCHHLKNEQKHRDALAELDPLLYPSEPFEVDYERSEFAKNDKRIDWHFHFDDGSSCLLDVKRRMKPLFSHIDEAIQAHHEEREPTAPSSEGLFKSSEEKFMSLQEPRWQGIWVVSDVSFDMNELETRFTNLEDDFVQFAVIKGLGSRGSILSMNESIRHWVIDRFNAQ